MGFTEIQGNVVCEIIIFRDGSQAKAGLCPLREMILIIKHIDIEGPGTLGAFFEETGWKMKIVELDKGDRLLLINEYEAIISLGGPMNVYEEAKYPFLKEEDKLIKMALQKETPILGICLGAQILAKACGARVMKSTQKEIGWQKVNLTDEGKRDPLFENMPGQLPVFQWHEDTFDIPEKGLHLAQSPACPNQAFRFGSNAYGLQFHIEVTPEMIESWVRAYTKKESIETKEMVIESYKAKGAFGKQAQMIYNNFSRIIAAERKIQVG